MEILKLRASFGGPLDALLIETGSPESETQKSCVRENTG